MSQNTDHYQDCKNQVWHFFPNINILHSPKCMNGGMSSTTLTCTSDMQPAQTTDSTVTKPNVTIMVLGATVAPPPPTGSISLPLA